MIISEIHNDRFKDAHINLMNIEKIKKTDKHVMFNKMSKLDKSFRGGFWHFTTERFFFIEDLMLEYNIQNVIHMENDNLIYFNIEDYKDIFEINYKIAAVFDNDVRCIPSFMYIKNVNYMSELTKFILDENNSKSDMEIIRDFKKHNDNVDNLPVVPKDYNNLPSQYFKNIDKFNSIFDGAAIGQYVGGVDPQNDSTMTQSDS